MEETKTGTVFIRTKKERNYTVMDNTFLRDERLSAKAKGIFAYILYLPEDWCIYQSELVKHFSDGKDALRAAIKELETLGYISKEHIKDIKTGRFTHWQYTVNETPNTPEADFPKLDFPKLENPPLLNTDNKINTNNNNSSDKPKSEPPHFINSDNEVKKSSRSKKPSKTELNEQYISTLSAKESAESQLVAELLITYLKPLQPTMHPETHLRAWQVEFAKFMKENNISYDSMVRVINFAFASYWRKCTFAAKNIIDNYGKIYQQMNTNPKSDYQKRRESDMERGNMNTGNKNYKLY